MDKIHNNNKIFIKNLEDHLELPIHFYGSILREDFNAITSDLDMSIFIKNDSDYKIYLDKILYYCQNNKIEDNKNIKIKIFKVNFLNYNGILINYVSDKIRFDIIIYNEKNKRAILLQNIQKSYTIHPVQIIILNFFKKLLYVHKIINIDTYNSIKNKLLVIGYEEIYNYFNKNKLYEINM